LWNTLHTILEEGPDLAADFWNVAMEANCYSSHPALQDINIRARTLPIFYHVDGAEVLNNVEFYIWSWSCLARGPSLDVKFPILAIPARCMHNHAIKKAVLDHVTQFLCWSDECLRSGLGPQLGFYSETFGKNSMRYALCSKELAGGWRACFAGFKADGKARRECHHFRRHAQVNGWHGTPIRTPKAATKISDCGHPHNTFLMSWVDWVCMLST
jgi:hypothetical protein